MVRESITAQLLRSRRDLLAGGNLLNALRREFPNLSDNMYVLESITDQYEDIVTVLIDGVTVATVEIPRHPSLKQEATVEACSVHDYARRARGFSHRTVKEARELASTLHDDD